MEAAPSFFSLEAALSRVQLPQFPRGARNGAATAGQHVGHVGFAAQQAAGNSRDVTIGEIARDFCRDDGGQDLDRVWLRLSDDRQTTIHSAAIGKKQANNREHAEPPGRRT